MSRFTWPGRRRPTLVTVDIARVPRKPRPARRSVPFVEPPIDPPRSISMAQTAKQPDQKTLTQTLRDQRQADEAARTAAGTWGDLSVGELTHRASGSVYIQVWKGP